MVLGSETVGGDDAQTDTAVAAGSAETRYARPWRPVKPLLIIWEVRQRWEAQPAQRRYEAWPSRYFVFGVDSGCPAARLGKREGIRNLGNWRDLRSLGIMASKKGNDERVWSTRL